MRCGVATRSVHRPRLPHGKNHPRPGHQRISLYNTLSPGDVVWLGTDDKPHNMKVGDVLEIEITGTGLPSQQGCGRRATITAGTNAAT